MRDWIFSLNEKAIINENVISGLPTKVGELVTVHEVLTHGSFDYVVTDENSDEFKVKESELNKVDKDDLILQLNIGDTIRRLNGVEAKIIQIDYINRQMEIEYEDGTYEVIPADLITHEIKEGENVSKFKKGDMVFVTDDKHKYKGKIGIIDTIENRDICVRSENDIFWLMEEQLELIGHETCELELINDKTKESKVSTDSEDKFTKIATYLGKFTDEKNKQYGSSVDATYKMIEVLMERYTYDDENYIMPKELLKHILLQVRIMDKQNRIFNNPSGKGDSESPYKDVVGYGLIGVDMVERNS